MRIRSKFSFLSAAARDVRRAQRIEQRKIVVGDMDAAVGAFGQRFLDGLLGALRPHRERHDFAAVLFFQAQGFFERVSCRARSFRNRCRFRGSKLSGDAERSVLGGNLLDADDDVHGVPLTLIG